MKCICDITVPWIRAYPVTVHCDKILSIRGKYKYLMQSQKWNNKKVYYRVMSIHKRARMIQDKSPHAHLPVVFVFLWTIFMISQRKPKLPNKRLSLTYRTHTTRLHHMYTNLSAGYHIQFFPVAEAGLFRPPDALSSHHWNHENFRKQLYLGHNGKMETLQRKKLTHNKAKMRNLIRINYKERKEGNVQS